MIPTPPGGDATGEFSELRCGDWDGDGWNDLVLDRHMGVVRGEAMSILLDNRDGTFRDVTSQTATMFAGEAQYCWPFPLLVRDINMDGRPDISPGAGSTPAI